MNSHGIWSWDEAQGKHFFDEKLANAIASIIFPRSLVFDLGCGPGFYCAHLSKKGFEVIGYDGTPNRWDIFPDIVEADLATRIDLPKVDVVLSLEVAEHIPREFESCFLDNLGDASGDLLILSWAVPGQSGYGHVNTRPNEYVKEEMKVRGLIFDVLKTKMLRREATLPWLDKTIMVFKHA